MPLVAEEGEQLEEQSQREPVLTRAETLEKLMVDQLPSRATLQPQVLAKADPEVEGTSGLRPGRLQAKIVAREEVDSVTWYKIRVEYDGTERECCKRYNDFMQFDKHLRQWLPCLNDMLPQIPSSGRIGLRHKLDLGTFNDRRQAGLEGFLDAAARVAGERPVRRFLLDGVTSGNLSPEYFAEVSKDGIPEVVVSEPTADMSAHPAAARGGC